MRYKNLVYLALAVVLPFQAWAKSPDNPTAQFNLSQQTMVPGVTLQPGSYSIHVLDHLKDRFIVRIDKDGGEAQTTFIGVPANRALSQATGGAVSWTTAPDGKAALRGFVFAKGGLSLEFVYPKEDAVALAKLNGSQVPAVDPASEGHAPEISGLNKEEMELITLWMLTPTHVGSAAGDHVQIKADKLTQMASAKPPIATLPHTGSLMPVIFLIGLVMMMGACLLGMIRVSAQRSI
jgi:LPXTG-motif cell wall-anchored protein